MATGMATGMQSADDKLAADHTDATDVDDPDCWPARTYTYYCVLMIVNDHILIETTSIAKAADTWFRGTCYGQGRTQRLARLQAKTRANAFRHNAARHVRRLGKQNR